MSSTIWLRALVVAHLLSTMLLAACGSPHYGSVADPTECAGDSCISWTGTRADNCEQFDPSKPNRAYQALPRRYSYTLPITAFFKVIQRNSQGIDVSTTAEQPVRIGSSNGQQLTICHATSIGGQVYTQRLKLVCATSRPLTNGATSANCNANELTAAEIEIDTTRLASLADKLRVGTQETAPRALAANEPHDCTAECNNKAGECARLSSTDLNSTLANLVGAWTPGKSLSAADFASVFSGVPDQCKRSANLVKGTGGIDNAAPAECSLKFDTSGLQTEVILPVHLVGQMELTQAGKQVSFNQPINSLRVKLPDELGVYSGPVSQLVAPSAKTFIDFRTPTMCFRISQH